MRRSTPPRAAKNKNQLSSMTGLTPAKKSFSSQKNNPSSSCPVGKTPKKKTPSKPTSSVSIPISIKKKNGKGDYIDSNNTSSEDEESVTAEIPSTNGASSQKNTHIPRPPRPPRLHKSSEDSGMEVLSVDGKRKNRSNSPVDDIDSVQSSVGDGEKKNSGKHDSSCDESYAVSEDLLRGKDIADLNSMYSDDLQFSEIEDSSVVVSSSKQVPNYSETEDMLIAKAFVNAKLNPIKGVAQKRISFYDQVHEKFKILQRTLLPKDKVFARTSKLIEQRWRRRISKGVLKTII